VTLALARLTLPRLLLTALPGLLALLTWLLLPAPAVLAALATLTAVSATLATLLTTLVLLARLLFIRIHNCSLVDPPPDNKRVRSKFLHLLVVYRTGPEAPTFRPHIGPEHQRRARMKRFGPFQACRSPSPGWNLCGSTGWQGSRRKKFNCVLRFASGCQGSLH
jgi:hypothetical protein